MEDQNYTIKDIARMAGVSAGTVVIRTERDSTITSGFRV